MNILSPRAGSGGQGSLEVFPELLVCSLCPRGSYRKWEGGRMLMSDGEKRLKVRRYC